jgi:hypothetical protein
MWVFAGVGLVFLLMYVVAGYKHWGWLFPAFIMGALLLTIWMVEAGIRETLLGTPIFVAIALPFIVAFLIDIHKNWWALIPAFVCVVMAVVMGLAFRIPDEWIGALFLYAVALPFLLVYLVNRERRWALIPAFTLGVLGTLPLISMANEWIGAIVVLLISIPFFYIYFIDNKRWWAIIPAGILASIGVQALLTVPVLGKFSQSNFPTAIMFLGWTATFGWLWRQREKYHTEWARIPALISGIVAIVLLVVGSLTEFGLIAVLVIVGIALIYFGLRPRKDQVQ